MTERIRPEVAAQVSRLFVKQAAAVFAAALRVVGDRAEAENLVQETFQVAALHWDQLAHHPSQRAWLCQVAIRRGRDSLRSRVRRPVPRAVPGDLTVESPGAGQAALTRMQAERCLRVIDEMPEMRRRVAYLSFHDGWANQRIADHLGISPDTVGKHVFGARADLRKALPEMSITDDQDGEADAGGEEAP